MKNSPFSAQEWLYILLRQQGLLQPPVSLEAAVQQLGYVQIDSINVVQRAHHHVLHSRLPQYQPSMLDDAVASGLVFEYWAHAAAYLPMADYRFSLYRKQQLKQGERHWHEPDQQMMAQVLARLRDEGPLTASDFNDDVKSRGSWWDWKPAKKALEQLFMQGDVMALRRDNFQKVYDLTERVLPATADTRLPDEAEFCRYLSRRYLQAHGFGTAAQIGYLRKNIKAALQAELNHMLEQGELAQFSYQGKMHYFLPEITAAAVGTGNTVWLLNPFDNVLIQRERLKQWFNFDYQIEVYVPADKRRFGYYSLAILWQTQMVGRVDVKADRASKTLLLQQLTLEEGAYDSHGLVDNSFMEAFEQALAAYTRFNDCVRWKLVSCNDKLLKQHYRRLQYIQA